jgi:hypothetical protein
MNFKKVFFAIIFLSSNSFCAQSRYIIFFANTPEVPNAVLDKITLSDRFCMVVPQDSNTTIPENFEGLISVGKVELAICLFPEPILPVFAEVSNANFKKNNKNGIFENYISDNLSSFIKNINKKSFGMFLSSAKMSHDLLYYFAESGLSWVNVDNIEENICGAYYVDGITIFSLYKDLPYSQQEVVKWLESKCNEAIVPVLLTKKHLQNVKFMEYIIGLFDSSKYIKPTTPLYIAKVKDNILQQRGISFEKVSLNPNIFEKIQSVAQALTNYMDSPSFSETVYSNAQSELVYLCEQDVLRKVSSDSVSARRMFEAAYNNIYRLLDLQTKNFNDSKNVAEEMIDSIVDTQNTTDTLRGQTSVEVIPGGVSIYNDGLLKFIQIISKDNMIKINFSFNDGDIWKEEVSFIDFYIDLNGISGMGGTYFIGGVTGFLVADSGWEYALRIYADKAILYKHSVDGAAIISNLIVNDNSVSIPTKYIRGNPGKWGFQAIVVSENAGQKAVVDFFNQCPKTKNELLSAKPFQVPLVRR